MFEGDAPSAEAAQAARDAIVLVAADQPARAGDVLNAEAAAVAALQRAGYADAAAGERRVVVDHATNQVAVHLNVRAGTHARLGALRVEPSEVFRQSFLDRLRNWRPGEEYSPEHMTQLRRDLSATGAVSRVSTRLEPAGADGMRDVVMEIEPAKPQRLRARLWLLHHRRRFGRSGMDAAQLHPPRGLAQSRHRARRTASKA